MSTALANPQTASMQWDNRELVDTLKQTVCKGATDAQFKMFVEVCKSTGLNPFLKEIWFVPSVGVMAGRDGYLRVANQHPMFDGMETKVERDDKNVPIKATCSVWRKDRNHPITTEAYYSEYRKGGTVWSTYPSAMISKVAEVLALKRSFSINGVVTEEEVGNNEERGSKEAQQDVAQKRIKELSAPPLAAREIGADLHPPDNPSYEERHKALILEANAVLDEVSTTPPAEAKRFFEPTKMVNKSDMEKLVQKPPRKRGSISFEALKKWGEIKQEILRLSGTTDLYYKALATAGYQHADEIKTKDDADKIWKALKEIAAELTPKQQDKALRLELETYQLAMTGERFFEVIGGAGFETIDDILVNANGDQLQAVLRELKAATARV